MNKMSNTFIKDFLDYLFDNQKIEGIYADEYSSTPHYLVCGDENESSRVRILNDEIDDFLGCKFYISCGATKMGIVFDDFDEVIKINLTGGLLAVLPDDAEDDSEDYEYELHNYDTDYIKLGEKMRNEVGSKIKNILLPHKFRFKYYNITVYTQDKIEPFFESAATNKKKVVISDKKMIEDTVKSSLNISFVQQLIDYYNLTEEDLKELDFPDMNDSNYGFLPYGVPVINDWEGYWE